MNYFVLLVLFILLCLIFTNTVKNINNNILGKIIILAVILLITCGNLVYGFIAATFYIFTINHNYESFDNKNTTSKEFREKNCKNGKPVDENGEIINSEEIGSVEFPNIKFFNNNCNPCDESCEFEITSNDQLHNENSLRPLESNSIPVTKNSNDDIEVSAVLTVNNTKKKFSN